MNPSDNDKPETQKTYKESIAWPLNVWTCYIPENINPQLNILEKLILSLVHQGLVTTKTDITNLLVKQINLNEDLVNNVLDICIKKHFNQTHTKTLKLKVDAEKLLDSLTKEISPDMEMSDITKKIYLFQDATTNTIVPIFNIETLSDIKTKHSDEKEIYTLPDKKQTILKTAAIDTALRRWGRLFKTLQEGDPTDSNRLDLTNDKHILIDDEPIKTLADKEKERPISAVTIFDDKPQKINAIGYLLFNADNPTELEVISPFGPVYNNWFMCQLNHLRITNESVNNKLQNFLKDCRDLFKDQIVHSDSDIPPLLNNCPNLANNTAARRYIGNLHKDILRYRRGENETDNFCKNIRLAVEGILALAINSSTDLLATKAKYKLNADRSSKEWKDTYYKYRTGLSRAINVFEADKKLDALRSEDIFVKFKYKQNDHAKNNLAILLLHAYDHQTDTAAAFVRDYTDILLNAYILTELGNGSSHVGENFTNRYISQEEAEAYYCEYSMIVQTIYAHLLNGNITPEPNTH